ncbi:MAG: PSD1 and planctomycete cytochrome C domain-containing protein [Bryobacterales bacterium]|nr:PSD1 and planctomycete cytochrome C domain-containing protein [Bryobacterales bacterium]
MFALLAGAPLVAGADEGERLFALEIKPLLAAKCLACHGQNPSLLMGGLDLTGQASALQGGQSGRAALVPGKPDESLLYLALSGDGPTLVMPPKETDQLSPAEVARVRAWIDLGAPWLSDEKAREIVAAADTAAVGVRMATSGGQSEDWTERLYKSENVWAFRPVRKPRLPQVAAANPVDAFHIARMAEAGLKPAPRADKLDLLRRAVFDLTGLPPTPEQAQAFLSDATPGAWQRLVNRLLTSPHYGEQWGRHWLDVARYADTAGNSNDYERSNAWRYRDYVVRSFNADKPYNQFVIEQLAGDELPGSDPEMLVATGFLRMGPWGSAMVPKKMARQAYLDDVVHSVGQAFLSMPLRCAKCHDHKVDPIPTRDYYRIYAALAGTQIAERPSEFLPEENRARFETGRQLVTQLRDFATERKQQLESKAEDAAREWFAERGLEYVPPAKRGNLPDSEKPPRHYGLTSADEGRLKVRKQDEWIWTRRLERYQPMVQSVFNGPDYIPGNGRKLRMPAKIDADWRPESTIFEGGSVHAPGEAVTPGVLSATQLATKTAPAESRFDLPADLDGRRLALAEWIVDERNPLTARSIVNRVWAYHFGKGLVATPNNLGGLGAKPSHPDLLDWLAADFVENGWSIKRLHRTIMTSQAYQQTSERADIEQVRTKDPQNRLLAYYAPRRLSAEELRDSVLRVSGELNPELGGLPAMPEINMEVALQPRMIQFSIAPAYQPSPNPAGRNRRSIYAYRVRGQADPLMEVFNQPSPNDSCERRDSSSVSPQALTMLNSDYMTKRSIAFALRLEREEADLASRLERAYRLAFSRPSEPGMTAKFAEYVAAMEAHHRSTSPRAETYPTQITRSLVEEFTGAPFEYQEWLPIYEDYQPDTRAWEVGPSTRALADLCLLLFNSNEFAYVY